MTLPTFSSPGPPTPHHGLPWTLSLQIGSLGLEPLPSHLPPGEPHPVQGLAPGMALTEAQALLQSSRYCPRSGTFVGGRDTRPGRGRPRGAVWPAGHRVCGHCESSPGSQGRNPTPSPVQPSSSEAKGRSRSHACGPLSAVSLILSGLGHRTGQAASTSILGSLEKPVGASKSPAQCWLLGSETWATTQRSGAWLGLGCSPLPVAS